MVSDMIICTYELSAVLAISLFEGVGYLVAFGAGILVIERIARRLLLGNEKRNAHNAQAYRPKRAVSRPKGFRKHTATWPTIPGGRNPKPHIHGRRFSPDGSGPTPNLGERRQ